MSDLDPSHPLTKAYREWKKWESIQSSGRTQYIRDSDEERHRITSGRSTKGLPEPASLAELQFWGEMKNAYEARFQDDLKRYLAANPERTREAVEQELEALILASIDGSDGSSRVKKSS